MAPPLNKGRRMVRITALTQGRLIECMLDGVYTCEQLAEETGLHYVTVLRYTRALYRAKAAYIASWEKDCRGRDAIKVYRIGRGRDAKREKLTAAQRQARYQAKKKALALCHLFAGKQTA